MHHVARAVAARHFRMIISVMASISSGCEDHCKSNPCRELNGASLNSECGGCQAPYRCRPGAPGFDDARVAEVDALGLVITADTDARADAIRLLTVGVLRNGGGVVAISISCDGSRAARIGVSDSDVVDDFSAWPEWSVHDPELPISSVSIARAHSRCAHPSSEATSQNCARPHMYSEYKSDEWYEDEELGFDEECINARHQEVYGDFGLPPAEGIAPSPPADLWPLGAQGQKRAPIEEISGCPDAGRWDELTARGRPYVLRDCVFAASPSVRGWTDEHLVRIAGNHTDRFCPETLEQAMHSAPHYRMCRVDNAPAILRSVAVPPPLWPGASCEHTYDKTVMWHARAGWEGRVSPLHFDGHDNLMMVVDGEKRVDLLPPIASALLYSDFTPKAAGNSPVMSDCDPTCGVDLRRHPLVASAPLHVADLRAGDVLFIPKYWWHVVTSAARVRQLALTVQFAPGCPEHEFGDSSFSASRAEYELQRASVQRTSSLRGGGSSSWHLAELRSHLELRSYLDRGKGEEE